MLSHTQSAPRMLAWRDRPARELLSLSWPIAVSLLSFGVMTLVDTLFLGTLGTSALAGAGLGGTAAFVLLTFPIGLLRGVKVLVSQSHGAGRAREASTFLGAGLLLGLVLGVIAAAMGLVLAELLPYLAATPSAGEAARTYLRVRILGAPLVLAFVALREFRYGEGDSKTPMRASIIGNAANIALNAFLVLGLDWGVAGSAWSTVLGHALELAVVAHAQSRLGFRWRDSERSHVRSIWQVGVPTGLQFVLEMGSFAILTAVVSTLGEHQMAAHQIALQVMHFSFLPTVALGEAGSVLAGQSVGAREDHLVRRVARVGLIMAVGYAATCAVVNTLLGDIILASFHAEPRVTPIARDLLRVAACFQLADGATIVIRGVLRGVGDVRVPAQMGIACAWICTPPIALFLGRYLGWGALGCWIGLCVELVVLALLCGWRLQRGAWQGLAEESRARLASLAAAEAH
jgi:multidrug resistance protein, MATE family